MSDCVELYEVQENNIQVDQTTKEVTVSIKQTAEKSIYLTLTFEQINTICKYILNKENLNKCSTCSSFQKALANKDYRCKKCVENELNNLTLKGWL